METPLFSVYDLRSKTYGVPWTVANDEMAAREFAASVRADNSKFGRFPEDFELWRIGKWDDLLGAVSNEDMTRLHRATEFVVKSDAVLPATVLQAMDALGTRMNLLLQKQLEFEAQQSARLAAKSFWARFREAF